MRLEFCLILLCCVACQFHESDVTPDAGFRAFEIKNVGDVSRMSLSDHYALLIVNGSLYVMGNPDKMPFPIPRPNDIKKFAVTPLDQAAPRIVKMLKVNLTNLDFHEPLSEAYVFAGEDVCALFVRNTNAEKNGIIWTNHALTNLTNVSSLIISRTKILYLTKTNGTIFQASLTNLTIPFSFEVLPSNISFSRLRGYQKSSCVYATTLKEIWSFCDDPKDFILAGRRANQSEFLPLNFTLMNSNDTINFTTVSDTHCLVYSIDKKVYGWGTNLRQNPSLLGYLTPDELKHNVSEPRCVTLDFVFLLDRIIAGSNSTFMVMKQIDEYVIHSIGEKGGYRAGHNRGYSKITLNLDKNCTPEIYTFDNKTCVCCNTTIHCFGGMASYIKYMNKYSREDIIEFTATLSAIILIYTVFMIINCRIVRERTLIYGSILMFAMIATHIFYLAAVLVHIDISLNSPGTETLRSPSLLILAILIILLNVADFILTVLFYLYIIRTAKLNKEKLHPILVIPPFLYLIHFGYAFLGIILGITDTHFLRVPKLSYPYMGTCLCYITATLILEVFDRNRAPARLQRKNDELLVKLLLDKSDEMQPHAFQFDLSLYRIPLSDLHHFEEIGIGASGCVMKAIWKKQFVAVKMYRSKEVDHIVLEQMFLHEFELLISLRHENIVNIHGACMESTMFGIVIEYCANGSLAKCINKGIIIENAEKKRILREIASGMMYLHEKKIVHRDLKCENVLIDDEMRAKITDFGISKKSSSTLQTYIGTNSYIAPEVFLCQRYDEKCDVYSYGIVIYNVLFQTVHPYGLQFEGIDSKVAYDPTFRPQIPNNASPFQLAMMEVAKQCWAHESLNRPSFEHIIYKLDNIDVQ